MSGGIFGFRTKANEDIQKRKEEMDLNDKPEKSHQIVPSLEFSENAIL